MSVLSQYHLSSALKADSLYSVYKESAFRALLKWHLSIIPVLSQSHLSSALKIQVLY